MTLRSAGMVALAGLCLVFAVRSCAAERAAASVRAENARLRTEAAEARLHALGYRTTLGHVTRSLRSTLAERDHWRALASEPDAEPVAYVAATATVEGRIEGGARAVVDSVGERFDRGGNPSQWESGTVSTAPILGFEGEVADRVFALRWRLLLGPPPSFVADVAARVPLELVAYRRPDGSLGVTAASRDSRVRVDVSDFVWVPPKVEGPSRWRWLLAGVAIGVVGWEMVR